MGSTNLQFTATMELLGKNLKACIQKVDECSYYVILPTNSSEDKEYTLNDAIADINSFVKGITNSSSDIINVGDITKSGQGVMKKFTGMKFKLNQAYLYIRKDGEKPAEVEYALEIGVVFGEEDKDEADFLDVKELSFSVWSYEELTGDAKKALEERFELVKKSMSIVDMSNPDKSIKEALQKSIDEMETKEKEEAKTE